MMTNQTREDYYEQIEEIYAQMYESKLHKWQKMMGKTRMEELFYELYASSKQHDSWLRYAMIVELRALMKQPIRGSSGSDHFERALDDEELVETEVATELLGIEDGPVKREANLEEESMPQFQAIANSEILKSSELGKVDLGLENEEYVVLNENLEQEWVQKKVKTNFEADGDVGKGQKMISDAYTCCAHKVFVKMSSKVKRIKQLKGWKFKFKPTSKRSKLMDDMFSVVEETALLKKDPKETIWDCVKKEFKETMAAYGKTRVDRFKLVEEKASRPEVLNLNQTCLYHQIGHGVDILLAIKMLDPDKEMAVVLQRSTSLTNRDCPDRSSQANRVWKPGGIKEVSLICLGIHNMKLKEEVDICFWTHHNLRCLITHSVLETTKLHETSSLVSLQKNAEMTIPLAKETRDWIVNTWFKIQVFSDFDIASWIGLEICGCETKKHMLLLMKLANRVWDCGELLATQVYRKWLENCYKHKWRSRLSHSFSEMKQRMIVSVWKSFGCLMEEMMEEDQKLQGDSEPLLTVPDFAARFCETFDQYTREKGSVGAERESESNQPTLRFSTWVIEILPNHYMVLLLTPVAYAIHFLGGVGMAKKQSHLSLWINRVWDPGRSLVKDASYSIRIFSSLPATLPVSLLCQESFAYQITSFSTNLEVKVSLKGEDLLQVYWTWAGSRSIFSSDSP